MEFMDKLTGYFCWTGKWEGGDFEKKFQDVFLQKISKEQHSTALTATTGTGC